MSVFYPVAVHDLMGLFGTNGMKLQAHFVPYACIYFVKCHTKKLLVTFFCSWQEMAHENQNDSDEIDASQSSFAVTATLILVPLKVLYNQLLEWI